MGNCSPPSLRSIENDFISHKLEQEMYDEHHKHKLLLLGTGNAGKSTFFRQFKIQYGTGISTPERDIYYEQIREQVIFFMARLVQYCIQKPTTQTSSMNPTVRDLILNHWSFLLSDLPRLNQTVAGQIDLLWKDEYIRNTFLDVHTRNRLSLPTTCDYFWNDIFRIADPEYYPTDQDCITVYNRTSGITKLEYAHKQANFRIVDIGGQRSERRKWLHVFDDVDFLLYVFSLSAYDEKLYEDRKTNAMKEQIDVFEKTVNSRHFKRTPVIVFLNKSDLLEKNIEDGRLISMYFKDYDGDGSFKSSVSFIQNQLSSRDRNPDREMIFHTTCATNTKDAKRVLGDVTQMVVTQGLKNQCIL